MVAVCRRTSFVVITPQIAIVGRLPELSCRYAPATHVPVSDKALHVTRLARGNPRRSAQSPGIWRCLQILPGGRHRDSAVIPAGASAATGNFDRDTPVRRADRLHRPWLTTRWRQAR